MLGRWTVSFNHCWTYWFSTYDPDKGYGPLAVSPLIELEFRGKKWQCRPSRNTAIGTQTSGQINVPKVGFWYLTHDFAQNGRNSLSKILGSTFVFLLLNRNEWHTLCSVKATNTINVDYQFRGPVKPFRPQLGLGRSSCISIDSRDHFDYNVALLDFISPFDRKILTKTLMTQNDLWDVTCHLTSQRSQVTWYIKYKYGTT